MEVKPNKSKSIRILLIIAGSISLALGVLGVFLPLLPTTPFLLLSAICYFHGSERMYIWLLDNRYFGKYIRDYREKQGVTRRVKIVALSLLWLTILNSIFFFVDVLVIKLLLLGIAFGASFIILRLKTIKN